MKNPGLVLAFCALLGHFSHARAQTVPATFAEAQTHLTARLAALREAAGGARPDAAAVGRILTVLPAEIDRYQLLRAGGDASLAGEAKAAIRLARTRPGAGELKDAQERLARLLAGNEPGVQSGAAAPPPNGRMPQAGSNQRAGAAVLQCAGGFDGGVCRAGAPSAAASGGRGGGSGRTALMTGRGGGVASGGNPLLDRTHVPPVSPASAACESAVNGPDPKAPQHPKIAGMCANHPTAAPMLAGFLDSVKESFGSTGAILMNLVFMLFGLVTAVLTGGVALILKLAALVFMSWAIAKMIGGLISAVSLYRDSKPGSKERASALRQIGVAGGSLLIMVMMVLAGVGAGKIKPVASVVRSMEAGTRTALVKTGVMGASTRANAMIPASVLVVLQRVMGAPKTAAAETPPARSAPPDVPAIVQARPVQTPRTRPVPAVVQTAPFPSPARNAHRPPRPPKPPEPPPETSGGRGAIVATAKPAFLKNPKNLEGLTIAEAASLMPKGWLVRPMRTGRGTVYEVPGTRGADIVQISRGNPRAPDPLHQGPYVKIVHAGTTTRVELKP